MVIIMRRIKVLLVAGSYQLLDALKRIVGADPELNIVAEANNAYVARDRILSSRPDVLLLCDDLPRMKGIAFLRKLMPQYPLPAVVICEPGREKEAYDAGAVSTAVLSLQNGTKDRELDQILTGDHINEKLKRACFPEMQGRPAEHTIQNNAAIASDYTTKVIAMGASTGGTEAMYQVVKQLKKDIPGIVMVQHMPPGFTRMYAQRLNNECEVDAREAVTGDIVRKGQILLAPGDKQMRLVKVNGLYQVECRVGPKVSGHCPSVDVLFESVAKTAGKEAIGILMTGMGRDGADGLYKMRQAGAVTIGQDEKTCVVYGMPKAAYDMGAVTYQVALEQIAQKIYYILDRKA